MSLIISSAFFIGENNVPNKTNAIVLERLNSIIGQYEPECLKTILGYKLYKAFKDDGYNDPTSQRMQDLLNGKEYTDLKGVLSYWDGLVHDTTLSLIASYIFFNFERVSATLTTGVATVIQKGEAAINTSPDQKQIDAWNYFAKQTRSLCSFLWSNQTTYPEFTRINLCQTLDIAKSINFFGI